MVIKEEKNNNKKSNNYPIKKQHKSCVYKITDNILYLNQNNDILQGPKGDKGDKGPKGDTGPMNTSVQNATGEPMGHENRLDSLIAFDYITRKFTIQPKTTSFNVWVLGNEFTKDVSNNIILDLSDGLHYIYYDGSGNLGAQQTYFKFNQQAPTAYTYYAIDYSNEYMLFDERHGIVMDWASHEYLHRTRGAQIASGFNINNIYTQTSSSNYFTDVSEAMFSISNGIFYDEDLKVSINNLNGSYDVWGQQLSPIAKLPIVYLDGKVWRKSTATNYAFYTNGSGIPYYNTINKTTGIGSISNSYNGSRYIIQWITATNMVNTPIIAIMSQALYNQNNLAENEIFDNLYLVGFPIVEFRPLYKVIYEIDTSKTIIKARVYKTQDIRKIDQTVLNII